MDLTDNRKLEGSSSQVDDGLHKAAVEGHLKVIADAELKLKKYSEIGNSLYCDFIPSKTNLTFSYSFWGSCPDKSPQKRKTSKNA